jgi:glutathione S-transferase
MRLRFTTGSPYARTVRIVLAELGLDYEKTEEITTSAAEIRAEDTPTLQVPALIDGSLKLWDSLVICEHLISNYAAKSVPHNDSPLVTSYVRTGREIPDRLQLATIQTLTASIAIISQLKWSGQGLENQFAARNADRMSYLLHWLEGELDNQAAGFVDGYLSVQDISLATALMFADNRPLGIDWSASGYPKISALVDRLKKRASFIDIPIWWWEPGVTGYSADGTPVYG